MRSLLDAIVLAVLVSIGPYLISGTTSLAVGSASAQVTTDAAIPPAVSRPVAGVMQNLTGRLPEAPFEIITSPGADYFVKLVDIATRLDAVTIYVRGGQRLEVEVPLGSYLMRYASGETWRGGTYLFGPDDLTSYHASDAVFNFNVSGGYVNGYTIELIRQVGGNMDTRPISAAQF